MVSAVLIDFDKIRSLRLSKNLSLDSIATAVGVTTTMINQVEWGHKDPGVKLLAKIADYLEYPIQDLIIRQAPHDFREMKEGIPDGENEPEAHSAKAENGEGSAQTTLARL